MANQLNSAIMEEREEVMMSARTGHFLSPSAAAVTTTTHPPSSPPTNNNEPINEFPSKLVFKGWKKPQKDWKAWVGRTYPLHQSTWRQAGVHEAIMNSTHTIPSNKSLIYAFAQTWCPMTNVFSLPWGEITITLEDMLILGGFQVMGKPVFVPLETLPDKRLLERLVQERLHISRSMAHKPFQTAWLNKFMDSGSDIEHEAFLAFWLSRFVFPHLCGETISKDVLPIAVLLAKGVEIALAPAVLATLYRGLSSLHGAILSANANNSLAQEPIKTHSPLQLVQLWVWERFPTISPQPKAVLQHGQPPFGRWADLHRPMSLQNMKLAMHSASQTFKWRPYAAYHDNPSLPYSEVEMHVPHAHFNDKLMSWAICLRVCELIGLEENHMEAYLPHGVAMQFGMDQDIPVHVERRNICREAAWLMYMRPIEDQTIYVPSSLSKPSVSARYFKWRNPWWLRDGSIGSFPPGFRPNMSMVQTNQGAENLGPTTSGSQRMF